VLVQELHDIELQSAHVDPSSFQNKLPLRSAKYLGLIDAELPAILADPAPGRVDSGRRSSLPPSASAKYSNGAR